MLYFTAVGANNVVLSGKAEPGATVAIYVDNAVVGVTFADEDGNYTITLDRAAAQGGMTARAFDAAGNVSMESDPATVDDGPLNLMVDSRGAFPLFGNSSALTLDALAAVLEEAKRLWIESMVVTVSPAALDGLRLTVADLPGGALAVHDGGTITLDQDAAGYGWFVDLSPADSSEFMPGAEPFLLTAREGSEAFGRVDLLTTVLHEIGHALDLPDVTRFVTTRLMSESLALGERRRISAQDAPAATVTSALVTAGAPATGALVNGDFAAGAGWTATGGAVVSGGVGTLAEDSRFLTALRQSFAIPAGAESVSFRILSATLGSSEGLPPDAFEAALIDPVTGASLLGALGGLTLSDAFLNLQADGTVHLAPGVIVQGDPLNGGAIVTLSLAGVDAANGVLLSFDLIGQGAIDSEIIIDDVRFGGSVNMPPLVRDDLALVDEDASVAIDMLANDQDVDGDPLSVTILTGPTSGTLLPPAVAGGAWTYVPDADFHGSDSFTYAVRDGVNAPVAGTVRVTVRPVNDAPILQTVADFSRAEGDAIAFALVASDVDDAAEALTYSLVSGPAGASVSADGRFAWTAAGDGAQAVTVRVTDAAGAAAETRFTITVTPRPQNAAPVIAAVAGRTARQGENIAILLTASDADHRPEELVFSLVSGPAGATVSSEGALLWRADAVGDQAFTVRVTDPDGAFSETGFIVAVSPVDDRGPVLAPIADLAVTAGDRVAFDLVADDPDDPREALLFALVEGPQGASVSAGGAFAWTAAGVGDVAVRVRVTDPQGNSAERSFTITVAAVTPNAAPVLAPIADLAATAGDRIDMLLTASDTDDAAATLTYALIDGPAGAAISADGRFTWTAGAPGRVEVVARVTDPHGAFDERRFAITVAAPANRAPVIGPLPTIAVKEGEAVEIILTAGDPDGPASALRWTLLSGPEGASLSGDGVLRWLAKDGDATEAFTVRVTDEHGASDTRSFTIAVADVAPTPSVTGAAVTDVGLGFTVALGLFDPGDDMPIEWLIDWGDGTAPVSVAGQAESASHVYASAGDFTVTAWLRNEDGVFAAPPLDVRVRAAPLLQVRSSEFVDGRLVVRFTQPVNGALLDARRVTLIGALTGAVEAVVSLDGTGQGIVIARADGRALHYDRYELVLDDDGFASLRGSVLDGDGDGAAGGDYRVLLHNAQADAGSAQLPDFMRGPGETVDVPLEERNGLQLRFASDGGVRTMTFTVTFDPALLRLDDVRAGVDLPDGARIAWQVEPAEGGKALLRVTIVSDSPIAAGSRSIIALDTVVPETAPYGASEILKVAVEMINAAAPTATQPDDALQLVGYYGDADGDRLLTVMDLWAITRVATGMDQGFDAWAGFPPDLVAKIADHRKFANPFLPGIEPVDPVTIPIHRSQSAEAAAFPPIAYGLKAAIDAWRGAIWATETPPFETPEDGEQPKAAEAGEAPAGKNPTDRTPRGEPASEGAVLDTNGVPRTPPEEGAPPAAMLDDADGLDPAVFLIALPALYTAREAKKARRRKKKEREE